MDHFEALIRLLLEQDGYWTFQSYKVKLPKETRAALGKPSMPRTEIDLLGYKPAENKLLVLEVKSFLNSPGVKPDDLLQEYSTPTGRYKLFTCTAYRTAVLHNLKLDLVKRGLCRQDSTLQFGLAAGRIYRNQSEQLRQSFAKRNWYLLSPEEIRKRTQVLSDLDYENDPFVIASKVLKTR